MEWPPKNVQSAKKKGRGAEEKRGRGENLLFTLSPFLLFVFSGFIFGFLASWVAWA